MDQAQNIIVNNLKIGKYGRVSEKFKKDLGLESSGKFYNIKNGINLKSLNQVREFIKNLS